MSGLVGATQYVLYARRWYILFVFCLVGCCQNALWNTFGPIEPFAIERYNTSPSMINFLSSLGAIVFVPTSFVSVWFVDRFGVRKTVVTTAFLCCVGAIIRCIFLDGFEYNIIFPITGQIFINAAGPIGMILQPKISSVWFGPTERTFATAISLQANVLGLALSFLVSMPVTRTSSVPFLLYLSAIVGMFTFVLTLLYFPDKPPTPPSVTGEMSGNHGQDNSPITVLKNSFQCLKSPPAFILIFFGSCPGGVFSGWGAMLVEIIRPLGYSEELSKYPSSIKKGTSLTKQSGLDFGLRLQVDLVELFLVKHMTSTNTTKLGCWFYSPSVFVVMDVLH